MTKQAPIVVNMKLKTLAILSLCLTISLTILSFLALPKLQTQYNLKQFLPKNHPLLKQDEETHQTFQLSDTQPFIITARLAETDSLWFDPHKIESLTRLTELLRHFPGVRSTLSIGNIQGAISSKKGLSVGPLLQSLSPDQWSTQILANPLISPTLVSTDAQTASILVNINPLNTTELKDLRNNLEVTAKAGLPFAQVDIGGTPAVQTDVGNLLQSEIRNFVILGFLASFVVLALIFANGSPLIMALIIIICANVIVLATMALAGYPFSILSSTIPILTTVDVVSLCIHTLLRLAEERKSHPLAQHEEVVKRTLRTMLRPNLIASTTTMIGFLSLLTTNVPLIKDYGFTAALSITLGWVVTTVLLLPLLLFLPEPRAREWAWSKARWGLYLFRRSGLWALMIVLTSLALALKGQSLSWSARLFDDLPQNHQVRLSTETIDKKLGGMIPVDLEITGPRDVWNDPALIVKLDHLLTEIRHTSGVGSVVGLPDLISSANLHHSRLPASRQATAETYFLYSLSNDSPLKNFLNADSSKTRIAIRTQDLPGNQLHELVESLRLKAAHVLNPLQVQVSGMGSTIHHLNNDLSHELIFGFWQSMAAIVLILLLVFRSLRWALVACIPNLVPPAALLGFLAVSQTPIKPSVAIIFSIALGLAFNNTVYFLERLRHLQFGTTQLNVEKTLWLEGNPCLISSLTILAGFSVFLASYFAMNRIFGFYMLLSLLSGLVGDLILLPTMLKSCPWLLAPLGWRKEKVMTIASSILFVAIVSIPRVGLAQTTVQTTGSVTVEKISQEMQQRISAKDEEFIAQMKIVEADGSSKEREMHIWRLSPAKNEHSILVRMLKPADLKGTALLATLKGSQEDKWIYLPSTKQTRRLTGESSQGGILGSELSAEDFDFNREQSASSQIKKEFEMNGHRYWLVESDVNANSPNYSRIVSYIAASEYLPIKAECFDKMGKLLKVIEFLNYQRVGKGKWRAGKIKIQNLQNKRGTEIQLKQVHLNQNLKATKFNSKNLADE